MPNKLSKKVSDFFRVALEGATTDGRKITREWIEQMAANFDRAKYGARIWMEHLRGTMPDGPFKAYGDVIALKAEEVVIDGIKKLALFAQLDPTDDLVAMNKERQKIYTSIEVDPDFAESGQAYLVGLGITDSPASLGTEVLAFAAQNPSASPFAGRKTNPNTLFSEAHETEIKFTDAQETEKPNGDGIQALSAKVKGMLAKFNGKSKTDEANFSDITESVETLLEHVVTLSEKVDAAAGDKDRIEKLETDLKQAQEDFNNLKTQLENTPDGQPPRHEATGGDGRIRTNC